MLLGRLATSRQNCVCSHTCACAKTHRYVDSQTHRHAPTHVHTSAIYTAAVTDPFSEDKASSPAFDVMTVLNPQAGGC